MCYQTEEDMATHLNTLKEAIHSFIKCLLNSYHTLGIMSAMLTGSCLAAMCGHMTKFWPTDVDKRNVNNFYIILCKKAPRSTYSFSLPAGWK